MKRSSIVFMLVFCSVLCIFPDTGASDTADFLFQTWMPGDIRYLYPETYYQINPAVLSELKKKIMIPRLSFNYSTVARTDIRLDDADGTEDGTMKLSSSTINPTLYFDLVMPEKKQVFGISLNGSYYKYEDVIKYNGYTSPDEDRTLTAPNSDNLENFYASGSGLYSLNLDTIRIGARLGGDFRYYPVGSRIPKARNASILDGDQYYSTTSNISYYSSMRASGFGTLGAMTKLGSGTFGLSLDAIFSSNNLSFFRAVDTDGDTYLESLVTEQEYYGTTETWGANGDTASDYYDRVDYTRALALNLHPFAVVPISKQFSIVVSGKWNAYYSEGSSWYTHISEDNQSKGDRFLTYTPDSFKLVVGLDVRALKNLEIRIGAGYDGYHYAVKRTVLNFDGENALNPGNTEGYYEGSWGTAGPANNVIVTNNYVAERTRRVFSALIGTVWEPMRGVYLIGNARVNGIMNTSIYRLYDTGTNTVWEEELTSGTLFDGLQWNVWTLSGLVMELSKNLTLSIGVNGFGYVNGGSQNNEDPVPVGNGNPTENGTVDRISTTNFSLETTIQFGISF